MRRLFTLGLSLLSLSLPLLAQADMATAMQAMEDPSHPLLLLRTSRGDLYVELFPESAPRNVANFIALAEAQVPMFDIATSSQVNPHYYDNKTFFRILRHYLVQAGAPRTTEEAAPEYYVDDEISAKALGLNDMKVLDETGALHPWLNIKDKEGFEAELLLPLYRKLNITTPADVETRQYDILKTLQNMTLRQAYENQGYTYNDRLAPRTPIRGSLAMASSGPNRNRSEFFMLLQDAPWLSGKATIIGTVVEGMEIVDRIDQAAVLRGDSTEATPTTATMIFDVRQLNTTTTQATSTQQPSALQ